MRCDDALDIRYDTIGIERCWAARGPPLSPSARQPTPLPALCGNYLAGPAAALPWSTVASGCGFPSPAVPGSASRALRDRSAVPGVLKRGTFRIVIGRAAAPLAAALRFPESQSP
jgi:hypothetical protein